jgi:hypothetical protein
MPSFHQGAGSAIVLLVQRATQCEDNLSAVFTLFLCVATSFLSALHNIRDVALGSLVGTVVGALFAVGGAFLLLSLLLCCCCCCVVVVFVVVVVVVFMLLLCDCFISRLLICDPFPAHLQCLSIR